MKKSDKNRISVFFGGGRFAAWLTAVFMAVLITAEAVVPVRAASAARSGSVSQGKASAASDYYWGDVDLNGSVQAVDALLVLKHTVKLKKIEDRIPYLLADIDESGELGSNDALRILQFVVKLVTPYHYGEEPPLTDTTPVGLHGQLSVKGTSLMDSHGKALQLKGISTHGTNWFPDYVNVDSFRCLRDNWNVNLVRLAMYVEEYNGYCAGGDQTQLKNLVCKGVDAAVSLGMYVIVDWHVLNDQNPLRHTEEAKSFFNEITARYRDCPNVLYEICNEPNGGTSWADIKSYAGQVIPVIRKNAPDAVILVGTPNWSQYVDEAAKSPITGYENLMYSLHFYAATHKDWLREKMNAALDQGLPLFVTEFGTCDASGSGANDLAEAETWLSALDRLGISYVCWNLSNKAETSALLNSGYSGTTDFPDSALSECGRWIKNRYLKSRE